MCQNSCQLVRRSRHRLEKVFFIIATLLTLTVFAVLLAVAANKQATAGFLKETLAAEYRAEHPEAAKLSEAEILNKISDEEKELISEVEGLNFALIALAPLGVVLLIVYSVGKIYGAARANGIRIHQGQFGEVYAIWAEMAGKLGMKTVPELYVQNGNGTLNAFATCILGYRAFGVIYSDILERALANDDEAALRFILGHELGHIRLNHVAWWYNLLTMAANFPGINYLIGLPLSRSREYGCDKLGFALSQDEGQRGLLMLAAGKHLYRQVDMADYEKEHLGKGGKWAAVHNFFGSHPNINWRIAALRQKRHGDVFWARSGK
ncbi:M48 family metallopeptidase [Conchiformibius kuhniae]|uniref:M48 family metallopeptidase n=1 Tax=Conchiformibius kuhniae TaxID=211502 RepID=A0A8T9MWR1_9NEIS|nr:M48 family metallopeptidase [Conchiformibius kuhniae]UOP05581.1 M48 family metallopeptidase [Conchiformibius kuhniae]